MTPEQQEARRRFCSELGKRTQAANARKGAAKAGAARTRHGHAKRGRKTSTYGIWEAMVARCHNPENINFHHYGGRGIRVCDSWRDFAAFLADMGERPAGLTLERKDGNNGYEPVNCEWATWKEQGRNRSANRLLTLGDRTQCVAAWAEDLGINDQAIRSRLNRGWSDAEALTISTAPAGRRRKRC